MIGSARRLAASASMRVQDAPDAALAHAGERLQATSKSLGIESIVLRYQGSSPTVS